MGHSLGQSPLETGYDWTEWQRELHCPHLSRVTRTMDEPVTAPIRLTAVIVQSTDDRMQIVEEHTLKVDPHILCQVDELHNWHESPTAVARRDREDDHVAHNCQMEEEGISFRASVWRADCS